MILFIGDLHFDDPNIIKFENRPFASVKDMNDHIIDAWNLTAGDNDEIYVVGDLGGNEHTLADYISQLNGIKYLIKGNHDVFTNQYYREIGFREVYDKPIILDDFWIISHEPMYVNMCSPYANIFGHVHNSPIYNTVTPRSYCVSAERTLYVPVEFGFIKSSVAYEDADRTFIEGLPYINIPGGEDK
jgi:calcineurin-like phosphoesterase family protein